MVKKTVLPVLVAPPWCCEMSTPSPPPDAVHSEEFLRLLMRRQLKLSVACAATFLVALLGLFGFTIGYAIFGTTAGGADADGDETGTERDDGDGCI